MSKPGREGGSRRLYDTNGRPARRLLVRPALNGMAVLSRSRTPHLLDEHTDALPLLHLYIKRVTLTTCNNVEIH